MLAASHPPSSFQSASASQARPRTSSAGFASSSATFASSAGGRPATSGGPLPLPAFAARAQTPGPLVAEGPRVGTAGRAFRPARSAASSSRIHGSWGARALGASPWSSNGGSNALLGSSASAASASLSSGPRISEPVRLDPPTQWGAPPHRRAGERPVRTPATGARGNNKLQDFNMLASACRRAGKLKEEAIAQYCSGVLLDNAGQRAKARECYARMLVAAQACPDDGAARAARMVAHNRLGVNLHALGEFEAAAQQHAAHLELSDAAGKFVGHLNLGLAQAALGQLDDASTSYRHALRSAIRSGSMQGEAVACGNLALVGKQSGDLETARACLDRYLQLTEALSDTVGAVEAHHRLGDLAAELGDLQSAGEHFESALSITTTQPEQQAALNATKIEIGLAQGNLQFSEWMLTGFGAAPAMPPRP